MNSTKPNKKQAYIDVTKEWIEHATPNSHKIKEMNYYSHQGKKYYVDVKNVILDYSQKELEVANWLKETFGGEIYMCPRINNPEGIKTPDYLWNNEYWDLKEIKGNGKHTFDTAIKKKRNQSLNFIFDISSSKITKREIVRQLKFIFKSKDRQWVNRIIIKRSKNLIVIFEHKKEINHQSQNTDQDQSH